MLVVEPSGEAHGFGDMQRCGDSLEIAASATTLGDLFSEVLYPAISSHRRVAPEERARLGITDGTLRMSVGIEDADDLIGDLDGALARA